jgi:hypothetical protein
MAAKQAKPDRISTRPIHKTTVFVTLPVQIFADKPELLDQALADLKLRGPHMTQHSLTETGQYMLIAQGPCAIITPKDAES